MLIVKEEDVVDRKPQQELFQELMEAKREARVFLIRDERQGCGKSTLLKRLRWNCLYRVKPRPLASLADLDYHDDPTPFSLIRKIGIDLNPKHGSDSGELPLPEFGALEKALSDRNPYPFLKPRLSEAGTLLQNVVAETFGFVDAREANITGGTVTGVSINEGTVNLPEIKALEWSEDLRPGAERAIVRAFFSDLRQLPRERRAVIFIDSVNEKERSPHPNLIDYVHEVLLDEIFLDPERRPENVVLCLAGRDLPDYRKRLEEDFDRLILAPELLSGWERDHTVDFLKLVLEKPVSEKVLDAVHEAIIDNRLPLDKASGAATLLAGGF